MNGFVEEDALEARILPDACVQSGGKPDREVQWPPGLAAGPAAGPTQNRD
jgi:hypothetical protein